MNAKAIRSLITGLFLLFVFGLVIFFYRDTQNGIKITRQSNINADSYVLGFDYSGIITSEPVKKGQYVHKGDALAYIKSSSLLVDINANKISKSDLTYPLSEDNQIIMQATQDGVLTDVNFLAGSYVPANQTIFKITASQAPYVVSRYDLSRTDFQKLNLKTELQVKLPSGRLVVSPIRQIMVDTSSNNTGSSVRVDIQSAIDPDRNLLIGSPVEATLHLEKQTKLQKFLHYIRGL
jgi:hypothetical protein